ncbi:benzoate transporter [Enterobacter cancerogenus]|uniref:Benzoate transporter n=1 Tax=Enterobacter cancerogenus TaxID=69218 RepID=A0A484XIW9_9ENTR|nr:benzoate transporter [Enterobacter cancerogenus]
MRSPLSSLPSHAGRVRCRTGRVRQLGGHHLAGCRCSGCQRAADCRLDDALGIGMGISTLALSWWYKAPVLTAWSTPGAALLATSLHGVTLSETIGVFIFANALILLCGATGLFARLMQLIPHSLAAAMLAGVLLHFGLQAFSHLDGHLLLCGSMLLAWLVAKALAPRYAIVATLLAGVASGMGRR